MGPYKIRSVDLTITAVFTNKCRQGAYRGFGSEVSNFVIERLVDAAVDELHLDPVEFRRKNFHPAAGMPLQDPDRQSLRPAAIIVLCSTKLCVCSTTKAGVGNKEEYRKQGRYVGIGIATCPGAQCVLGNRILDAQ